MDHGQQGASEQLMNLVHGVAAGRGAKRPWSARLPILPIRRALPQQEAEKPGGVRA
jgi:hypothetical protein